MWIGPKNQNKKKKARGIPQKAWRKLLTPPSHIHTSTFIFTGRAAVCHCSLPQEKKWNKAKLITSFFHSSSRLRHCNNCPRNTHTSHTTCTCTSQTDTSCRVRSLWGPRSCISERTHAENIQYSFGSLKHNNIDYLYEIKRFKKKCLACLLFSKLKKADKFKQYSIKLFTFISLFNFILFFL